MRAAGILMAALLSAGAADWPQWRGPGSQGVAEGARLPEKWGSEEGLAWSAELGGTGVSSPVVVGDLVVVTSQAGGGGEASGRDPRLARDERTLAARENSISTRPSPDGRVWLLVEAFRKRDGARAWQARIAAHPGRQPDLHEKHNLATPTPASDGHRVFAWFGDGQVVALDLKGRELWRQDLAERHGPFENQWGHGSSPAVHKGLVFLLCDHREAAYLLALDAATGAVRWKVERGRQRVSHSTPVVVAGPRGEELIVNSSERIDAYDPSSGRLLWHAGSERQTPIPSAVSADGTIYLSRGYRNSDILALRPGGRGDVSESHLRWRMPNGGSYVPSILHYRGLLYMTNEVGVVTCADAATGETVWRERLGGIFFASPVAGDGKVYFTSETGEVFVLRAGRKAEVLARNETGQRLLASPALADGRIYLRGDGRLLAAGPR
jgi:outer membrane protein assembly factor BamB